MKRTVAIAIGLMLLAASPMHAADYDNCFVPGEVVEYKMYWMGLPLAWSRTTTDMVTRDGKELFRVRMVAQTYDAYTYIYEVDDMTEVLIDPETALPVRHEWIVNEGTIHKHHVTDFYHDKKIAIFRDRISRDIREVPIESDTQEIFSFLYASRNIDLKELASRKYRLLVTGKMYDMKIKITGAEDIEVPGFGDVASIEVEPIADFDGIFLRKGKVFFWVSKETRRVVTCVKAKVAVGSITGKLQSVSGEGKAFWNKEKNR